jgi:hypothetical protein
MISRKGTMDIDLSSLPAGPAKRQMMDSVLLASG